MIKQIIQLEVVNLYCKIRHYIIFAYFATLSNFRAFFYPNRLEGVFVGSLVILGLNCVNYLFFDSFIKNTLILFLLSITSYHFLRKDNLFLKHFKKASFYLFFEYVLLFNSIFFSLYLKGAFVILLAVHLFLFVLANLPNTAQIKRKVTYSPLFLMIHDGVFFQYFRKKRIYIHKSVLIIFLVLAVVLDNPFIFYLTLIVLSFIHAQPNFIHENNYLYVQFLARRNRFLFQKLTMDSINILISSSFFYLVGILFFPEGLTFLFIAISFVLPLINSVLKYQFFHQPIKQNVIFHLMFFLVWFTLGLALVFCFVYLFFTRNKSVLHAQS